jgi:hypothetical protein
MVSDGCALQVGPETTVGIGEGQMETDEESNYSTMYLKYTK